MAETQELENKIAALELELANLSAALENRLPMLAMVTCLGRRHPCPGRDGCRNWQCGRGGLVGR